MEITFDLVDYNKLAGIKAEEIFFKIFENDEYADILFVKSGYDFGIPDSYSLFGKLQDICERIKNMHGEASDVRQQILENGLFKIFIPSMMYDDLGFSEFPDEGYISSVSSEHLRIVDRCFRRFSENYLGDILVYAEDDYRSTLQEYLFSCSAMICHGAQHDLGLLIHMG